MMNRRLLLVLVTGLFLSFVSVARAQVNGAADSLRVQAARMANGFVTADYKTFIHYLHPKVIEISGGADQLKGYLKQTVQTMQQQGMQFLSATVDGQTAFIRQGDQLQATIQQHTSIKLPQGHVVTSSTLIGISVDNGRQWRFADTNNKTLDDMKKLLPSLSNAIVIPPQQAPLHYDN